MFSFVAFVSFCNNFLCDRSAELRTFGELSRAVEAFVIFCLFFELFAPFRGFPSWSALVLQ